MSVGGLYHSRQLTVIAAEKNWTKTKTIYSLIELMLTGKREDLRSRLQDICVFENDWLCVDIFIRKWLVATPSLCGYNSTATDIDFLVHQHDTSPALRTTSTLHTQLTLTMRVSRPSLSRPVSQIFIAPADNFYTGPWSLSSPLSHQCWEASLILTKI